MKKREYNHKQIERKWQKVWKDEKVYKVKDSSKKPKSYVLDMFPYPSGEGLHVGHPKGYIATDIYSRFKRLQGYNVLRPMGWDAFGLPAENYALKHKVNPQKAVDINVKRYKDQISNIGLAYDWDREINTTDPAYYKWTQWIFLQMFKAGLAYESHEPINWCPSCKTGLANEDLEADGTCERCGSEVEKKPLRQWVLEITKYADRLLKDLDLLTEWPESIKESQRNWIGRSEGADISFKLKPAYRQAGLKTEDSKLKDEEIKVFTTRVDTIFSGTFIVLAPEHPFIEKHADDIANIDQVREYISSVKNKSEIDRLNPNNKTGVILAGIEVINPATKETMPVWVADFVLGSYGSGAVFADAHDERDFEMAQKYNIPLKTSIAPVNASQGELGSIQNLQVCFSGEGVLYNSAQFDGMTSKEARPKIINWLAKEKQAVKKVNYKLKDWVFSRQRYWGEPIPLVRCPACAIKDHKKKVAITLNFRDQKIWKSILKGHKTIETRALNPDEPQRYFGNIKAGDYVLFKNAKTEQELLVHAKGVKTYPTFKDLFADKLAIAKILPNTIITNLLDLKQSYAALAPGYEKTIEQNGLVALEFDVVMKPVAVPEKQLPIELPKVKSYEPTGTGESPLADIDSWVNTICPECKSVAYRETNTMPQWAGSCWYYLRFIDPHNTKSFCDTKKEKYWMPVDLYVGGAEHATRHLIYARFWHKFLYDKGFVSTKEPFTALKNQGLILAADGRKMSKRYGNVINPDEIVERFGADTLRVYEMFMSPFEAASNWSNDSIMGSRRFLDRVWRLAEKVETKATLTPELEYVYHSTIKEVTADIADFKFNTAISQLMILSNELEKQESILPAMYQDFIILLSPIAPHIAEEIYHSLGNTKTVVDAAWPVYDESKLQRKTITIAIQINGKVRDTVEISPDAEQGDVEREVLSREKIVRWLGGQKPKKVIYIKGKIINLVM